MKAICTMANTRVFANQINLIAKRSIHMTCAATSATSRPAPIPWHKIKIAEEGELQEEDEFAHRKKDRRGDFINEEDQQRYLTQEIAEWKVEALEDYYHFPAVNYPEIEPIKYDKDTVRTGLVATKVGMTNEWDPVWGEFHTCTVLHVEPTRVVQVKTKKTDGYDAIQLGTGKRKIKNFTSQQLGHLKRWGDAAPFPILKEFRVSDTCLLPVGTELGALHFTPGQYVDVKGTTVGKGWAGPVKRWGFRGQPASHGAEKVHRAHGSMGGRQDPGRIFPGKKMAGHMGDKPRVMQNLKIFKIQPQRGFIFVLGSVPGHKGNTVVIQDAVKLRYKKSELAKKRYFPTFTAKDLTAMKPEDRQAKELFFPFAAVDPNTGDDDNKTK